MAEVVDGELNVDNNSNHNNNNAVDGTDGGVEGGGGGASEAEVATAAPSAAAASTTAPTPAAGGPAAPAYDDANEELALLFQTQRLTQQEVSSLQGILRENVALKDKISKLKSLLGRSAKAQRDSKLELDSVKQQLVQSQAQVTRLQHKVEALNARPTHMDLLADFEANFDRAVLSLGAGGGGGQSAGEEAQDSAAALAAAAAAAAAADGAEAVGGGGGGGGGGEVVSSMLMTELQETRARMERLEGLNAALLHRASKLEKANESLEKERESSAARLTNVQLELRMARMEADAAARAVREKSQSLSEMQLEIDLVTKSAMDANVRAAEGLQVAKTIKTDQAHVEELEAKVVALQEWALASAEAKRLSVERTYELERKLRDLTSGSGGGGGGSDDYGGDWGDDGLDFGGPTRSGSATGSSGGGGGLLSSDHDGGIMERLLWTKTSSMVIGAGMVGSLVVPLDSEDLNEPIQLQVNETVVLRWKFDVTPADLDIVFFLFKGRINGQDSKQVQDAQALIKERTVVGGGAGEVEGAFAVQRACTLYWSNMKSWVRPRAIKFTVETYAVM